MNRLKQNQYESSNQDGSLSFSRLQRVGALTTLIATGALFGANHASPARTREATSADPKITQTSALESQRSANLESLVPTTDKGHLEINGKPTIPRFYWAIDPAEAPRALADGINFFLSADGGRTQELSQVVGNNGYLLTWDGQQSDVMPNVVGVVLGDEPESHNIPPEQLPTVNSNFKVISFTDKFTGGLAPSVGKDAYPEYIKKATVVGFNEYLWNRWYGWQSFKKNGPPGIINFCSVFNLQKVLAKLAGGKPTFQYIETGTIDSASNQIPLPPEVIFAEAMGSFAAGAKGIGWWGHTWTKGGNHDTFDIPAANEAMVAYTNHKLDDWTPMLTSPNVDVGEIPKNDPVKVGAWLYKGNVVVEVVNLSSTARSVNRRIFPALGNQKQVDVVKDPLRPEVIRTITSGKNQHLRDNIPEVPWEVRWYRYRPQAGVVLKDMVTGKPLRNNRR